MTKNEINASEKSIPDALHEDCFVVESPVNLHLRPAKDIVEYFIRFRDTYPSLKACLKLDSIDPEFREEEQGMECNDPTSMTKVMMLFLHGSMGYDTERRFRVVLRGEHDAVFSIAGRVRDELMSLVATWTRYTIANRTIDD